MNPQPGCGSSAPRRSSAALTWRHRPAIPAVCAVAAGIWLDQWAEWDLWFWLLLGGLLALAAITTRLLRRNVLHGRAGLVFLFVMALLGIAGGARHHATVQMRPADDLSTWGGTEPQLVRVQGVVVSPIEVRDPPVGPQIPAWMEIDRSVLRLRCQRLFAGSEGFSASGLVQLEVTGHLPDVRVGDRLLVLGQLSLPQPPANPGGGDFAQALREQGVSGILRCDHPATVSILGQEPGLVAALGRLRDRVRRRCQQLLVQELQPSQQALASSLLIGDRTGLTEDVRVQFSESGAMHLLAISGVHVSILYGIVWAVCRLLNMSFGRTVWVLLLCVALYAFIADHRPPVMRAAVLAGLGLLGTARGRNVDGMNALAVTALLLLLWHPADLFDVGAQLSFLAVAAIVAIHQWGALRSERSLQDSDLSPERTPWQDWLALRGRGLAWALGVTAYVWVVTLPLTVSVFHLVAPVGLLANLFLIPYSTLVLGLGFAFLGVGLLAPWGVGMVAAPFRWSLDFFQSCVSLAGNWDAGHSYWPAPPGWWQLGFYLLLVISWGWLGQGATARRGGQVWLAWLALGLALPLWPRSDRELRCTFLSVGHGLASVIELPGGPVLVYDAGTLGDGRRAERAIENYLWSRGRVRVDALLITHADHDHFSGSFGLLEKLQIRQLSLPQTALAELESGIPELCERAAAQGVPVRLLQAGDELVSRVRASQEVTLRVLHPAGDFRSRFDNANSLVLEIGYAGRRILLTGDLEQDGLQELLARPATTVDVLLAPHHGGAAANVPELYLWAQPRVVIASTADELSTGLVRAAEKARVLSTATSGAITVRIDPAGKLTVDEYLPSLTD